MPKGRASARAQRAQKARAPKLVEDDKSLLGLRGSTSSPIGMACMKDLVRFVETRRMPGGASPCHSHPLLVDSRSSH